MTERTAQHQLGEFIVAFQRLEEWVDNLLVLLSETPMVASIDEDKISDNNVVRILVNELEFTKRLKTADVLFAYMLDVATEFKEQEKNNKRKQFHSTISKIIKFAERRNDLVHSKYHLWKDTDGNMGLLRRNSKLRAGKGEREEIEEELQPEDFTEDLVMLEQEFIVLEAFRQEIIQWQYPDIPA